MSSSAPAMEQKIELRKRFGRAWKVEVITVRPDPNSDQMLQTTTYSFGSTAWQPETLHIRFDTTQSFAGWWYCDLTIYNLNSPVEQDMITYGMICKLSAGYQSDQVLGTIFQGMIIQPLWEREEGINYKLTLHCMVGVLEGTNNFVSETFGGNVTQRVLVQQMAQACRQPLNAQNVDPLGTDPITRATTIFGQPQDFLQNVADTNNALFWVSNLAANIRSLREATTVSQLNYDETNGLIGTPQQTQQGVVITVLLDSRATLLQQIKLSSRVTVAQLTRQQGRYPTILSPVGNTYTIGCVHHYGDSRGNDWYTEITGFINGASILALQVQF